jgi:hypothetical protein
LVSERMTSSFLTVGGGDVLAERLAVDRRAVGVQQAGDAAISLRIALMPPARSTSSMW